MMRMLYEVRKWSIVKTTQEQKEEVYDELLDFSEKEETIEDSLHPY